MTKDEFINQDLPVGTIFQDFFSRVKLEVVSRQRGMHGCDGCYYQNTECIPNGREAIAPQCGCTEREDGGWVKFIRAPENAEITQLVSKRTESEKQDEYLSTNYPDSIRLDGLDDAIIGMSTAGNIIYSVEKIIDIFVQRDHMTHEEAGEFFDYNVERAIPYMTDGIPPILMEQILM